MRHEDLVPRYLKGHGVEIGAFKTPIPGIAPVYVDRFDRYANEATGAQYYGDAGALPFRTSSLDYVATSHVIEHVADPIAAFAEWCRVLRHGGIIYMVVPDRRLTFDHPRPLTTVEHMLDDHRRGTTQVDGTHIDDFTFGVDPSFFGPDRSSDDVMRERRALADSYRQRIGEGQEINIHFHTFEPESMQALLQAAAHVITPRCRLQVLELIWRFPDDNPIGFLVVARVEKPLLDRIAARIMRPSPEVLPGTKRF
jgi:SAM-dependent methyltransferase